MGFGDSPWLPSAHPAWKSIEHPDPACSDSFLLEWVVLILPCLISQIFEAGRGLGPHCFELGLGHCRCSLNRRPPGQPGARLPLSSCKFYRIRCRLLEVFQWASQSLLTCLSPSWQVTDFESRWSLSPGLARDIVFRIEAIFWKSFLPRGSLSEPEAHSPPAKRVWWESHVAALSFVVPAHCEPFTWEKPRQQV